MVFLHSYFVCWRTQSFDDSGHPLQSRGEYAIPFSSLVVLPQFLVVFKDSSPEEAQPNCGSFFSSKRIGRFGLSILPLLGICTGCIHELVRG